MLNAANEVAVELFLNKRLPFLAIPEIIEQTMASIAWEPDGDLDVLLASDAQARVQATLFAARSTDL